MSNLPPLFERTCERESIKFPKVEKLSGGRWRVTRYLRLDKNRILGSAYPEYDMPDRADPLSECTEAFANLRLVAIASEADGAKYDNQQQVVIEVYETLTSTFAEEMPDRTEIDTNGLKRTVRSLIALPDVDVSGYVVGQSTLGTSPEQYLAVMKDVREEGDTGATRRVTMVYMEAGVVSDNTTISNNGALTVRKITSFYSTPETPDDFVLVDTKLDDGLGFPTHGYTFVRGSGEISRSESPQGDGPVMVVSIRYLSAPTVDNSPITTPSGYVLMSQDLNESEGHRVWNAAYGKGGDVVKLDENGRRTLARVILQSASSVYNAGVIGSTISVSGVNYALSSEQVVGTSFYRRVDQIFIEATSVVTQVGVDKVGRDPNGRETREAIFIQLRSSSYAAPAPASSYGSTGCVFVSELEEGDLAVRRVTRTYLQATSEWVAVGPDKTDRELNGLLRVKRLLVAQAGTTPPSLVVGSTTIIYGSTTCYLGAYSDAGSDLSVARIEASYLQAGVLSKSLSGGPSQLPATIRQTWATWIVDATNETEMTAAGAGPALTGVVLDIDTDNVQGFLARKFTSLSKPDGGEIVGVLATYPVNIDITRAGEVSVGEDSNTPFLIQKPPTSGTVQATVTVELTDSAEGEVPVAFNLDNIYVSVIAKTRTKSYIGTEDGGSLIINVYGEQIRIDHTTLRGYVISSSENSGEEFEYEYNSALNSDGDSIVGEAYKSYIYRTITLTGSEAGEDFPATSGVWRRDVEPVFNGLDGTVYYRVTTWTI